MKKYLLSHITIIDNMSRINNEDHFIKDFYSKYKIKYKLQLEMFYKENPNVSNLHDVINIMEFDGKVAIALSNMHNKMNKNNVELDPDFYLISTNAIINQIRSTSECLKHINKIFFIKEHVTRLGTVIISDIAETLGYDERDSKKLKMLLFHDIRNALSHIDYRHVYDNDDSFKSIIWMDMKHEPHEASYKELFKIADRMDYLSKMYQELYREYFLQAS